MQKINRPLKPLPIDLLLISIDICQRVTCNVLKINYLKIEKNKNNNNNNPEWSKRPFLAIHQ